MSVVIETERWSVVDDNAALVNSGGVQLAQFMSFTHEKNVFQLR
jgi:hypothetical protein